MSTFLDLVSPLRCLDCGTPADGELCAGCAQRVEAITAPMCERCGAPAPVPTSRCAGCHDFRHFATARSLVVFREPARVLTLALKRKGRRAHVAAIGALIADLVRREGLGDDATITFVPGGKHTRRAGFDHARLLANAVAHSLCAESRALLVRAQDGPRQADVPFVERRRNVEGRFAARPTRGDVLLVDDVFTTGATADACAMALQQAGADDVNVVTWARTLRRLPRRASILSV